MNLRLVRLGPLALVAVIGCNRDAATSRPVVTQRDSAGVVIISNGESGQWSGAERWTVEVEFQIGGATNDSNYQFGRIAGIVASSSGTIFVLDRLAREVKVFGRDGSFIRTFGTAGGGPGELGQNAGPILLAGGDTLVVPDPSNQRVNLYAPDGTSIGSYRWNPLGEEGLVYRWKTTPFGVVVNQVRPIALPATSTTPERERGVGRDVVATRRLDGSVIDTLLTFPSGATYSMASGSPRFKLFVPEPVWAVAEDGRVFHGTTDRYRIEVYRGGVLERVILRNIEPVPVSEADQKLAKDGLVRSLSAGGWSPQQIALVEPTMSFAEHFPSHMFIEVGPNGSLWIRHFEIPSGLGADERERYDPFRSVSRNWDVFDAEGRYLGVVVMPARIIPQMFVDDVIYGTLRDELDVESVVRLRIHMN